MENGLSYGPGIAPAHSNVMWLAALNKMALWWVGGVWIYNIPLAAKHTTTYALIHGQEMGTSRGTSYKQPLNYNSQQVKTSGSLVLTQPWGDIHNTGHQHTIEAERAQSVYWLNYKLDNHLNQLYGPNWYLFSG